MKNLKNSIRYLIEAAIDEQILLDAICDKLEDEIDYEDLAETVLNVLDIDDMARDIAIEML